MIFPSLKSLPVQPLGRKFYEWEYEPPWSKKLVWVLPIALLVGLWAYLYFTDPGDHFLKRYAEPISYSILSLLSIFVPLAGAAWRKKVYTFFDYGFAIHYGTMKKQQQGGGWSYWKEFERAELRDDSVRLFPKKPLYRTVSLYCPNNRMSVYTHVSQKIAEARYRTVSDADE